jgi:hypothetical protein
MYSLPVYLTQHTYHLLHPSHWASCTPQ